MESPRTVLEKWVELFNQRRAEFLANLYHEDAINHQITNDPVHGKEDIQAMFVEEFSGANMTCIVENIFVDGEWAI